MSEKMIYKKECVVRLPKGIHARPSAKIMDTVEENNNIFIKRQDNGQIADANGILPILALGIQCNDEIIIYTDKDSDECKKMVDELHEFMSSEHEEYLT